MKIPNRVGAKTQPCFTPLWMSKKSDNELLMMLRSLGKHLILGRILKRSSLLIRLKAFIRSMNAMKSLLPVFLLLLSEGESHIDGGPVGLETALRFWIDSLSSSPWSLLSATVAKSFPTQLKREMQR